MKEIDERCQGLKVPNNTGRLPTNISSNYGRFKASQWQSWITVYSAVVLKDLLPQEHYCTWLLFVRACHILGQRVLQESDIVVADMLLLKFCKDFETLYGKDRCTPNLHLHLHLKQCFLDYGPAHSFWCYSFERYNGLLGSYSTNNKAVEVQIMRKFIYSQHLRNNKNYADSYILTLFHNNDDSIKTNGTLEDSEAFHQLRKMSKAKLEAIQSFASSSFIIIQFKPLSIRVCFLQVHLNY